MKQKQSNQSHQNEEEKMDEENQNNQENNEEQERNQQQQQEEADEEKQSPKNQEANKQEQNFDQNQDQEGNEVEEEEQGEGQEEVQGEEEEEGEGEGSGEEGKEKEAASKKGQALAEGQVQVQVQAQAQQQQFGQGQEKQKRESENAKMDQQLNQEELPKQEDKREIKNKAINEQKNINIKKDESKMQDEKKAKQKIQSQRQKKSQLTDKNKNMNKNKSSEYLNKLQSKYYDSIQKTNNLQQQIKNLTKQKQILKVKNEQLQQDSILKHKTMNETNQTITTMRKQMQKSIKKIENLQKQLNCYREIGDISVLQRRVEELQGLVENQKNQLKLFQQNNQIQEQEQKQKVSKQVLCKIQELEKCYEESMDKINLLQRQLKEKQQNLEQNAIDMSSMDDKIKQHIQNNTNLQEDIENQRISIANQTNFYKERIAKLEEQLANGNQHQSIQEIIRDKEISLREYAKLELTKQILQQSNSQIKSQLLLLQLENKQNQKQKISKKQYKQLMKKYMKCKACLKNAILQNEQLQAVKKGSQMDGQEQGRVEVQKRYGNEMQEEQNVQTKKFLQIFKNHVENSLQYLNDSTEISNNSRIQKLKQELKELKIQLELSVNKEKRFQRLSEILEKQLIYKNKILEKLVNNHSHLRKQYNELNQQYLKIQHQLSDSLFAKGSLSRLEKSSSNLLVKNRRLAGETQKWKQQYYSLKQKYENMLEKRNIQPEQHMMVDQQKQQQQIKTKKIIIHEQPKETQQKEIQTQGLSNYYYKELREMLVLIRKFPNKTNNLITEFQKHEEELNELSKKFRGMQDRFNKKSLEIKNQKDENDKWRASVKEEIVKEFKDIRDFIDNDRLVGVLRRAKYLIQELGKVQEEDNK